MPIGYSCRHCGHSPMNGKRPRRMRTFKGRSRAQIFESIKEWVTTLEERCDRNWFTKEEISIALQVKEHKVELALQELNRKGFVTKPQHIPPPDTRRNVMQPGGSDSAWQGDIYHIRKRKQ